MSGDYTKIQRVLAAIKQPRNKLVCNHVILPFFCGGDGWEGGGAGELGRPCSCENKSNSIATSMASHRGHNCISSALTILDSALTS